MNSSTYFVSMYLIWCLVPYTAYWSGIVMGAEQQHMDSHKKMVIAVAVASTSLGAVILCVLCIWIYYTKYPSKSKGKNVQRSAFYFLPFITIPFLRILWNLIGENFFIFIYMFCFHFVSYFYTGKNDNRKQ